jgi:hypothetical protein
MNSRWSILASNFSPSSCRFLCRCAHRTTRVGSDRAFPSIPRFVTEHAACLCRYPPWSSDSPPLDRFRAYDEKCRFDPASPTVVRITFFP